MNEAQPTDSATREAFFAMAWMLAGVSLAHALRFFLFDDPLARQLIAGAGVVLYGLTSALLWRQKALGVWLAIGGPLGGLSLVLLTRNPVDPYQVGVGVSQFIALGYGIRLLVTKSRNTAGS